MMEPVAYSSGWTFFSPVFATKSNTADGKLELASVDFLACLVQAQSEDEFSIDSSVRTTSYNSVASLDAEVASTHAAKKIR